MARKMANKVGKSIYTGDSIADNIKKQVKSIPQALGFDLFEQFVKPLPGNAAEQLFGKKSKKSEGVVDYRDFSQDGHRPTETILFSADEEQKKQQATLREVTAQRQIEYILSQLDNERKSYGMQIGQLTETIETVAEMAGVKTTLSIEQQGRNQGVYHLHLFEKILSFLRTKAEDATDWSQGMIVRSQSKRARGLQIFWQKDSSKQQVTERGTMMLQG